MSLQPSTDPAITTVACEAAVDLALAAHSANRAASRDLPRAERIAARRASSAACMAAIDEALDTFRAAIAPCASASDPATVHFRHEFDLAIPSQPRPVKAVAALKVHLGVPEIDRLSIFLPSAAGRESVVEFGPRTDVGRRALREIRGRQAGAIRKRAFELAEADAELMLIASW